MRLAISSWPSEGASIRTRPLEMLPEVRYEAAPLYSICHFHRKEHAMLDIVLLALGLGFFALSVVYTYVCEQL